MPRTVAPYIVSKPIRARSTPRESRRILRFPAQKLPDAILSWSVPICRLPTRSLHNLLHLGMGRATSLPAHAVTRGGHYRACRAARHPGAIGPEPHPNFIEVFDSAPFRDRYREVERAAEDGQTGLTTAH